MLIRTATRVGTQRRGVILLVVLALLTLFAILGLSFVFYSDAEATSSRVAREGQTLTRSGSDTDRSIIDATAAWKNFLGQLIYDVNDDNFGVMSALRGHSLARTMYGWNDTQLYYGPSAVPSAQLVYQLNDKPYCGTGRLNETIALGGGNTMGGQDGVNYTFFPGDNWGLRDPGRQGTRGGVPQYVQGQPLPADNRGQLVGDVNVPYTYPDQNNMFLAMIDPSSGQVKVPSYYRPWMKFGSLLNPNPPNPNPNPYWTNPQGKYYSMRPRPWDMGGINATFPYPPDQTGDVKNLDWAPGGNDSIWIDLNLPVITLPDGSQYKMLAAPLIIDMDGRVNMNVAGNIMLSTTANNNTTYTHASNQGWGPYEVSLSTVLNSNTTEWTNVFRGNTNANGIAVQGRYGFAGTPLPTTALPTAGGQPVRAYFQMDYNGLLESGNPGYPGLSKQWVLPTNNNTPSCYQIFPTYDPANGYGNYQPPNTTNSNEISPPNPVHASIYNPMRPGYYYDPVQKTTNRNLAFSYNDLAAMLRLSNQGGDNVSSSLLDLLPNNLVGTGLTDSNAMGRRARVATHSFDLDRPGLLPYVFTSGQSYTYGGAIGGYPTVATGGMAFPTLGQPNNDPFSEFSSTWQSVYAGLGRIDLGRKLTNYPTPDAATFMFKASDLPTVQQALSDRQKLATDIFAVLWKVTGAGSPTTATVGTPQFNALRYLAQLAVNIVDFIDSDDYSTPFQWVSGQWVFGTEMPRLVINEYYAQWDNDPTSLVANGASFKVAPTGAGVNNRINIWAELYSTFPPDVNDPQPNGDVLLHNGTNPVYELVVVKQASTGLTKIRNADNTLGAPDSDPQNNLTPPIPSAAVTQVVYNWGNGGALTKITTGYQLNNGVYNSQYNSPNWTNNQPPIGPSNQGFCVVGPQLVAKQYAAPLTNANPNQAPNPNLTALTMYQDPALTFTIAADDANINPINPINNVDYRPALLLRRLANPYLPAQTDPTKDSPATPYNPYITIDYVDRVNLTSGVGNGNDARLFNQVGNNPSFNNVINRQARGRVQPFAAYNDTNANLSQWKGQNPSPAPTAANPTPLNTFYRQNAVENAGPPGAGVGQTLQLPFDVNYHPDRVPISLAHLLHVSGFKPHEFTQQFVFPYNGTVMHFAHRAPWTDDSAVIQRLWDFLTISGRTNGPALGGRIPGKININTVWDPTIFQALCDAQQANQFLSTDVANIWKQLITNRDQNGGTVGPGSTNYPQPFWSLGMGYTVTPTLAMTPPPMPPGDLITPTPSTTRGLQNTPFSNSTGTAGAVGGPQSDLSQLRLLEPNTATLPGAQPVKRFELLSKIMGNVTTRSNVFAVWVTIGFFQVPPGGANQRPVQLGAEYNWPGTQTPMRHKFFAIIDRTQLQVWPTYNASNQAMVTSGSQVVITNPATSVTAGVNLVDANGNAIAAANPPKAANPVINPNTNRAWLPGWLQTNPVSGSTTVLTFDPDTDNEETVFVPNTGANAGQPIFRKSHAAGCIVISRGNPGPWTVPYDPSQDSAVVPYAAKIN